MRDISRKNYPGPGLIPNVPVADLIRGYYGQFDEWGRLAEGNFRGLEFRTTLEYLVKHLPRKGHILDAGGGPGRYTIELARRGYDVTLLDITPKLLDIARTQIARRRVQSRVKGIDLGSVVDLSVYGPRSFDAVACLGGVLSHVTKAPDRDRAVRELVRVAKPGSPIFVSVIGRLATLPRQIDMPRKVYQRILRTGDWGGSHGFPPAHFFRADELVGLLERNGVRVVESVGLEGLATNRAREVYALAREHPGWWKAFLELHGDTRTIPSVVDVSAHILVVGHRP